jgi:hypothetical protein
MQKMIVKLGHSDSDVRQLARETLGALSQHGDIP